MKKIKFISGRKTDRLPIQNDSKAYKKDTNNLANEKHEEITETILNDVPNSTIPVSLPSSTPNMIGVTDTKGNAYKSNVIYKPLVKTKLTIILLENTCDVANQIDNITKIIKSIVTSGYICIIKYGNEVEISEVKDIDEIVKNNDFLGINSFSNESCLYDALMELKTVVDDNYQQIIDTKDKRMKIEDIEIIGIGNATDNCSAIHKKMAIICFHNLTRNLKQIPTKYFCISEESVVNAAEIGFRSIGSINRSYL